jgi:glycosidase
VNVEAQRRDPDSLLNWMERLIRRRKECPELGWGRLELLEASGPVLAHRCDWQDRTIVAVHNLTGSTATVRLPGDDGWERLVDQFGTDDAAPGEELELEPYGHRWFRPG